MSESQSRYSIVERLTRQKLDLMSAKASLNDDAKKKEQKVEQKRQALEMWKENIADEIKEVVKEKEEEHSRFLRREESELKIAQMEAEMAKENIKDKELSYDERIGEINGALLSILEISKSSNTP